MTNFERIKAMTIEDMANEMAFCSFIEDCLLDDCRKCRMMWLESEVQDEAD